MASYYAPQQSAETPGRTHQATVNYDTTILAVPFTFPKSIVHKEPDAPYVEATEFLLNAMHAATTSPTAFESYMLQLVPSGYIVDAVDFARNENTNRLEFHSLIISFSTKDQYNAYIAELRNIHGCIAYAMMAQIGDQTVGWFHNMIYEQSCPSLHTFNFYMAMKMTDIS